MPSAPETGRRRRDEQGSALIMTLMVLALVTALATTVSVLTINNLQSSWKSQQAGAALNAADAGVAQAMSYLRNNGVRALACSPSCSTNSWGNESSPTRVNLPGKAGQSYSTWIRVLAAFPQNDPGRYRIYSTGEAAGAASRAVSVDVNVTTTDVPKGIFARTINGGGDASVARESVFSTGCVYNRSKIQMVEGELDAAYGIPIGVHSSQYITDSNGTTQYCPESDRKLIHRTGNKNQTEVPCNTSYPYDQDRLGGSLVGTPCESTMSTYSDYYGERDLDGDGSIDVRGSWIKDDEALFRLFGIRQPALTQAQIDQLRTIAQSQGNWHQKSTGWASPDEDNAVMFFDLAQMDPGGTVDLNDITGFSRAENLSSTHPDCTTKSLVIVVDGGNVKLNSNHRLYASLFLTSSAPYGQVLKANGSSEFIGTIYADTVNLTGTADISLDDCFLSNVSPALLDLRMGSYRELDRGLG
jgi:Tfp pilus assembly protein PilX